MMPTNLYVGYFVAGGEVRDLANYPNLDCARDTLRDSVRAWQDVETNREITEARIVRIDGDGSWETVELFDGNEV